VSKRSVLKGFGQKGEVPPMGSRVLKTLRMPWNFEAADSDNSSQVNSQVGKGQSLGARFGKFKAPPLKFRGFNIESTTQCTNPEAWLLG